MGARILRAREAWRGRGGHGLLYFLCEADAEGGEDRRAVLAPAETVAEIPEAELRERWGTAAPLTVTERRFRAPDGRLWLAQSVGPVWAEGGAVGLGEILFTSLEGPTERFAAADGHVGRMEVEALAEAWRRGSTPAA